MWVLSRGWRRNPYARPRRKWTRLPLPRRLFPTKTSTLRSPFTGRSAPSFIILSVSLGCRFNALFDTAELSVLIVSVTYRCDAPGDVCVCRVCLPIAVLCYVYVVVGIDNKSIKTCSYLPTVSSPFSHKNNYFDRFVSHCGDVRGRPECQLTQRTPRASSMLMVIRLQQWHRIPSSMLPFWFD